MENAMNQKVIYSASTALIAGLLVSNLAWAQMNYPINNTDFINNTDPNDPRYLDRRYPVMDTRIERRQAYYSYNNYGNGYPSQEYPYSRAYDYSYDNGNPFGIVTAPIAALAAPVTALTAPIGQAVAAPFAAATDATTSLMTGRSVANGQDVFHSGQILRIIPNLMGW